MKYQYRAVTDGLYTSDYGRAFLLLMNGGTSGRKITLRSLEVFVSSVLAAVGLPASLVKCASMVGGESMAHCGATLDSASLTLPYSGVSVKRSASPNTVTSVITRADLQRRTGAVGTQNRVIFGMPMTIGSNRRGAGAGLWGSAMSRGGAAGTEPLTVNPNEAVALLVDSTASSGCNHVRVALTISIDGHTANFDFTALAMPGQAIFSVENTSAVVVKILRFGVMDVGTTDTPTLRVVPVGSLYPRDIADPMHILPTSSVVKMDSAYPSLPSAVIRLRSPWILWATCTSPS